MREWQKGAIIGGVTLGALKFADKHTLKNIPVIPEPTFIHSELPAPIAFAYAYQIGVGSAVGGVAMHVLNR